MGSDTGDGWCVECGDYFHLDDCGGYNPPCPGCGNCRGCCECYLDEADEEDWDEEDSEDYPAVSPPAAPTTEGPRDGEPDADR